MAHFAKIDENNIVVDVIVADQDVIDSGEFGDPASWIQTSYNTHGGHHYDQEGQIDGPGLRKNYAGIGMLYDPGLDAFYPAKPYPSWVLDTESCLWEPPVPMPTEGLPADWAWDEDTLSWVPRA
jgi:hypothetical protein